MKNELGYRVDGDVAKLPKWAQSYIGLLEREVGTLRKEAAVQGDVAQTNVVFSRPASLDSEYLPKNVRVEFRLPSVAFPSKHFRIRVMITSDGTLDINADSRIWISPNASNSLVIGESK